MEVDPTIFEEILTYQRLRFPGWPQQPVVEHTFKTDISRYFYSLTAGFEAPEIQNEPTTVTFRDHTRIADSFAEFAATMVRGGLTVDLLESDIEGDKTARDLEEEGSLAKSRWLMEQRNLDKLKTEFDRITG